MLHKPLDGENVYEISVYNKEVRSLVKENQSHKHYDDHWADCQLHDVVAADEAEARRLADERYPESDGFVIEAVNITEV
jgi:hypothetical protein